MPSSRPRCIAATEFERITLLRQWVRDRWTNGWDIGALAYVPSWDARVILTLAPENLSLGMCTHYATVLVQCAQGLALPIVCRYVKPGLETIGEVIQAGRVVPLDGAPGRVQGSCAGIEWLAVEVRKRDVRQVCPQPSREPDDRWSSRKLHVARGKMLAQCVKGIHG